MLNTQQMPNMSQSELTILLRVFQVLTVVGLQEERKALVARIRQAEERYGAWWTWHAFLFVSFVWQCIWRRTNRERLNQHCIHTENNGERPGTYGPMLWCMSTCQAKNYE